MNYQLYNLATSGFLDIPAKLPLHRFLSFYLVDTGLSETVSFQPIIVQSDIIYRVRNPFREEIQQIGFSYQTTDIHTNPSLLLSASSGYRAYVYIRTHPDRTLLISLLEAASAQALCQNKSPVARKERAW